MGEEEMEVAITCPDSGVKTVVCVRCSDFIAVVQYDRSENQIGAVAIPFDMVDAVIHAMQNVKGFLQ